MTKRKTSNKNKWATVATQTTRVTRSSKATQTIPPPSPSKQLELTKPKKISLAKVAVVIVFRFTKSNLSKPKKKAPKPPRRVSLRRALKKMAVKKNELGQDNDSKLDLKALGKYLQMMNEQLIYLPRPNELIKNCQDIVQCLTTATGQEEGLSRLLRSVETFLLRVMNAVNCGLRHEIITAVLDHLYSLISDPLSVASPATSAVLVVLDGLDNEGVLSNARWLVQQGANSPQGASLKAALSCLYTWVYDWRGTPSLGNWVVAYIKALEENERFDILIEVTVEHLDRLFAALDEPVSMRPSAANVVFHVLPALRESNEALDRVSPHARVVLTSLASDTRQSSRQFLQNVVDILTSMVDNLGGQLKGDAREAFKQKHKDLFSCLECHMASRGSTFKQQQPWKARDVTFSPVQPKPVGRKVGLLNLGNTCYMNSVMQALLVTRQFSTYVMLRMNAVPYWSKMGVLFAKMMYSYNSKLNPDEFFTVVKPPFFTVNNQHDSSEFLGYLFVLLQSYEHCSDVNFDYSRPAVLTAATSRLSRVVYSTTPQPSSSSNDDYTPPVTRRSSSPRPSGSAAGPSAGGKRALSKTDIVSPPKKRFRHSFDSSFLRRDSIIDTMFGGVLITRVECTVCHSSSLSRDVFRDLQLAFPDKPDSSQHSVQSLLEYYCSKESLSGDNKYQCRDCGCLRDAERSVLVETAPKYLILVLKNFKFEPKVQVQTKLMQPMHHNQTVNLPTVRSSHSQHSSYTLFAAVIHNGTTLDSGHYYTLAKDNDQWHIYNDEIVTSADEAEFSRLHPNCTPYILFYRRADVEEGTAPALEDLPPKVQECVMAHNKHYIENVRSIHLTRP